MAESHQQGESHQKPSKPQNPSVRVNSSKVTPLTQENLNQVEPKSKFAEWRQRRQSEKESAENNVTSIRTSSIPADAKARKPRRLKRLLWTLGSLLALALLFIGVVFYSPLLATRTITVEGAHLLSQSTVVDQLAPLEGKPLTRISDQDVQNLLGNSTVLRKVSVEARPPHELLVTLHERVPVAVVEDNNKFMMVDADGVKLGDVDSVQDAGVPLIKGGLDVVQTPEFKTVTAVLAALPKDLLSQVQEASADSTSTISLKMTDDTQVVWGTAEDSELKAKVLTQLRSSLGEKGAVQTYDVSSPLVPTTK
ncbi:MAG: cell division protein FtsQ/DivIB [Rothia sp. (in: high G+C Gram-positive bacteria)]|nr:cell division protein FtsQ/DivIB [Rothia sp. (in: high G+C Gram-positive bacteria)]